MDKVTCRISLTTPLLMMDELHVHRILEVEDIRFYDNSITFYDESVIDVADKAEELVGFLKQCGYEVTGVEIKG